MHYYALRFNWAGSRSCVQYRNLLDTNAHPLHDWLSFIVVPRPRFFNAWKSPRYQAQCMQKNSTTEPDLDYTGIIHVIGNMWSHKNGEETTLVVGRGPIRTYESVQWPPPTQYTGKGIKERSLKHILDTVAIVATRRVKII
jgi:hypothetical protein